MKFLLDEGVPVSVGRVLEDAGHEVIFFMKSGLTKGTPDAVVCSAAQSSNAILVAADADMKKLAKGHGVTPAQFKKMGLVRFECPKPMTTHRIKVALSLIEHEHTKVDGTICARLFVVISEGAIRSYR
ncbi:hypothetical protein EN784_01140 [bacterium M00.F.Ca.ET.141.01.1.1]|nr:hypothetical protein EN784_01140 [bacterium M00.F.Ca.ET.141.01.1.1]